MLLFVVMDCERVNIDVDVVTFEWRWRKDALVSEDNVLINLTKIMVPTLVICGDKDPYLNMDRVKTSLDLLPDGSELKVIPGGSHIVLYEKNCYREFQDSVAAFLTGE